MQIRLFIISALLLFFSCGNERVLHLPEIQNAKITEVLDVSPAYIFYNETKPDSVELNRKNLIISTNWLINVDKRLTLKQALPSILKLQDKKRNATMHKNENARNFYTCNDTSIKNLGFIDFTEVFYQNASIDKDSANIKTLKPLAFYQNNSETDKKIALSVVLLKDGKTSFNNEIISISDLSKQLASVIKEINAKGFILEFWFKKEFTFQDYITYKSMITSIENETLSISNTEFIY